MTQYQCKQLNPHELLLKDGEVFIKQTPTKFEEIKRMAWEIYLQTITYCADCEIYFYGEIKDAWEAAEEFHDFAKQKEKETEGDE
jgi:hypothetical protein